MRVIGEDIWVAESTMKMPLMKLGIRSTVIRLDNNNLMVISPIRPTPKWVEQISELGIVKFIIAPNCLHHLYLSKFAVNFSEAEIWGPADLFDKRQDIQFAAALTDTELMPWSQYVDVCLVKAKSPVFEEFVFFHKKSKTLIVTDVFFNWQIFNNFTEKMFAKLNGAYKKLTMTRMAKMAFKNAASLNALANKIEAWAPENIIVAHGDVIIGNAAAVLAEPLKKLRAK